MYDDEVAQLKEDEAFPGRYVRGAGLVAASWGWAVSTSPLCSLRIVEVVGPRRLLGGDARRPKRPGEIGVPDEDGSDVLLACVREPAGTSAGPARCIPQAP